MHVGILGPLAVTDDGRAVEVGGARLRALLTRLALDPGRPVGTEALADAVWGDAQPADLANALQSLVSRLRRTVPGIPVLLGPGGYRLDLPTESVDAERFTALARDGRDALHGGDPEKAAGLLRDALALWRGPALADVGDAAFAVAPVARLEELRLAAVEDRIDADLRLAGAAHLVAELDELAAAHPLRERLWALRLRALAAAGRPAEALAAYEEFRQRLADELGADPSAELREVHLAVLRGADKPKVGPRGNLRAALTSFVGRATELRRVARLLAEGRLVTLVGPGGAGKTRLATVAADALGAEETWMVELAPVTDPADVPQAALVTIDGRAAGFTEPSRRQANRDALTRLVEALATSDALVVLDNCEHVIDAAARLADELLARCPRLRVLATSREPLGITGEALCPLPPLGLPERAAVDPAEVEAYPSIQLFRDRAAAVRPDFAVTADNVGDVVEICRRLDGLPLAIELAAARLRTLSTAQVAARLDDRFRLLTGGSRTALERHRTLRAVVAWSWELLTDDERRLIERLAVFPSTITAESAAGVAAPEVPVDVVADLLAALVDKSLLQLVGDGRFRMLETIREYGLERLIETGDAPRWRAAHAAWFLARAELIDPHLRTRDQLHWLDQFDADRANIIGALHYAAEIDDADTAIRLAAALTMPLTIRGDHEQAVALLGRALAAQGPAPAGHRAVVTAMHLLNQMFSGAWPGEQAIQDLVILVRAAPPGTHPFLPVIEPIMTLFNEETERGLAAVAEGLDDADPFTRGLLLSLRGSIKENDGDADGMLEDLLAAAEIQREIGERWSLGMTLGSLSDALSKRGDLAGATAAMEEATRLAAELNARDDAGFQRIWLASLRAQGGDVEGARADLARFLAELPRHGQANRTGAFIVMILGEFDRHEGKLAEAMERYREAQRMQDAALLVAPQFPGMLRGFEAHVAIAEGRYADARSLISSGIAHAMQGKDMPVIALVGVATVSLRAALGRFESAAETLGATDSLRGSPDLSNYDAMSLAQVLRDRLGDETYDSAYARGRGLSRADALALVDPAHDEIPSDAAPIEPDGQRGEDQDDPDRPEQ
ncbi:BTAD domain-containing putative transcriptional regulator [Asanoa sp. WMMD1127]|uniref:BTAD domain-containing putative transcriptional regulator n=1 Tax=Asanoa sp. WMMD1127 TaxID=3016107 RepID=UPI0024179F7C|nr:BTAD domain-containing putative transcriptional regulator [Asanoa sp. WMMD1127]MDG4824164.1 BTAD domain-containing putative transcriptional regulator [Asanoa sp. WMMD1127]